MFRIEPVAGPAAFRTYQFVAPVSTHWAPATCAEVDCPDYLLGWRTVVDESKELGERQAHFIRHDAERRHVEARQPDGLTTFTFEAGQRCYGGQHQRRLDRAERFFIRGGDHRGNPAGIRPAEVSAQSWVDDFGEHQDRLTAAIERG